jgi:ELP3 family radical SAM enzyme/protein acetyltransferase
MCDIEDIIRNPSEKNKFTNIINSSFFSKINIKIIEHIINNLIELNIKNEEDFKINLRKLAKKYKYLPKKNHILFVYKQLIQHNIIKSNINLENYLTSSNVRALSGVLVITVVTSPKFLSCPKNCHFCPSEPGQPKSYLSKEPAVSRANRNNFDPIKQFIDRAMANYINGHSVDKIEIIVLGGTWSIYPESYREEFIRDLYFAANEFYNTTTIQRKKDSLQKEQEINETSKCRIIGLTLETRPDYINPSEIKRLRNYGCTRVQLGIQHTDNKILEKNNRECTIEDGIRALKMLKDSCYKIDAHVMPDLPGSTPLDDFYMMLQMLENPNLQFDQWKIYPCEITPYTKIKEWYEQGIYKPYTDIDNKLLIYVIMLIKNRVHPWIRLNRVIRDIPNTYIIAGNKKTHLRQEIHKEMKNIGLTCECIRCREIKNNTDKYNPKDAVLFCRKYEASDGDEYFLSFETNDKKIIYGFLRLRLTKNAGYIKKRKINKLVFPELKNSALIRELHVYGKITKVGHKKNDSSQHFGFGTRLIKAAEKIAYDHNYKKVSIISGVGVKEYYKKFGYQKEETFMTKKLINNIDNQDKIHVINYKLNGYNKPININVINNISNMIHYINNNKNSKLIINNYFDNPNNYKQIYFILIILLLILFLFYNK